MDKDNDILIYVYMCYCWFVFFISCFDIGMFDFG